MSENDVKPKREDVALVLGPTEGGLRVMRIQGEQGKPPEKVEVGEVRPIQPGQTGFGEYVHLKQRGKSNVCDIETMTQAAPPVETRSSHGPAQVATPAYREGWDRIFGKVKPNEEAN